MSAMLDIPRIGWGIMAKTGHPTAVLLERAVSTLRATAARCPHCYGRGESTSTWEARIMSDDGRLIDRPFAFASRQRAKKYGARVLPLVRGAGVLREPCPECREIRQVLNLCEVSK